MQLLYKGVLPAKIGMRYGSSMVCWSPTKIKGTTNKQNTYSSLVWSKLKAYMDMVSFFGAAKPYIFRQYITFHPNNLVHLRLCHQFAGCSLYIVIQSLHPIFWGCFNGFLTKLDWKLQNMTLWPNMENMSFYDFITLYRLRGGAIFVSKICFLVPQSTEKLWLLWF